jgi:hypothetical protein
MMTPILPAPRTRTFVIAVFPRVSIERPDSGNARRKAGDTIGFADVLAKLRQNGVERNRIPFRQPSGARTGAIPRNWIMR